MPETQRLSGPMRKLRAQMRGLIRMVMVAREPEVVADALHAVDDHIFATQRCLDGARADSGECASSGEASQQ